MRSSADRDVSQRVESRRDKLQEHRREETQQELDNLEAYAEAERERIEKRRRELQRKAQVISLALEVENVYLAIPI
jgi:hypothetical protein